MFSFLEQKELNNITKILIEVTFQLHDTQTKLAIELFHTFARSIFSPGREGTPSNIEV